MAFSLSLWYLGRTFLMVYIIKISHMATATVFPNLEGSRKWLVSLPRVNQWRLFKRNIMCTVQYILHHTHIWIINKFTISEIFKSIFPVGSLVINSSCISRGNIILAINKFIYRHLLPNGPANWKKELYQQPSDGNHNTSEEGLQVYIPVINNNISKDSR